MIKHYCDRCGKEIESQVYYITITSDSLTSLNGYDKRQTLESASCNFVAHLSSPKIYCQECRDEIEKFMNKSGQQPHTSKGENYMNLYYVWQDENEDYDTYDSFVICAENEDEAKNTHPDGNWKRTTWASSPDNVKCDLIGIASDNLEKGIVIASFNAG